MAFLTNVLLSLLTRIAFRNSFQNPLIFSQTSFPSPSRLRFQNEKFVNWGGKFELENGILFDADLKNIASAAF